MATTIRRLGTDDAPAYVEVRLRGLEEHPEAFGASYAEDKARPMDEVKSWINGAHGSAVFGAFEDGALIGLAGLYRQVRDKCGHKATVWGMYVIPDARGRGLGRELLHTTIDHARTIPEVSTVHIGVNVKNTAARTLYLADGFETWGIEVDAMRIDGESQDEEHMRMEIR